MISALSYRSISQNPSSLQKLEWKKQSVMQIKGRQYAQRPATASYWHFFYISLMPLLQVELALCVSLVLAAAPGWSIWQGGMWTIPDDDGDNIPGVGFLPDNAGS